MACQLQETKMKKVLLSTTLALAISAVSAGGLEPSPQLIRDAFNDPNRSVAIGAYSKGVLNTLKELQRIGAIETTLCGVEGVDQWELQELVNDYPLDSFLSNDGIGGLHFLYWSLYARYGCE